MMRQIWLKILVIVIIQSIVLQAFAQVAPENLKTALVYRIANCVKWNDDASPEFVIGVSSENQLLIDKFNELSKVARINKKPIRIKLVPNLNSIQTAHLLYFDQSINEVLPSVISQLSKQNRLIITEEYQKIGDIMINLKLDEKKSIYTFEYNRANILFAGLDITDEIVLLKGTEIEIRELYLQSKKQWDEQQTIVAELKKQSDVQMKDMAVKNDSIYKMKSVIDYNQSEITRQLIFIAQKDSLSNDLNLNINAQQARLNQNLQQTEKLLQERKNTEELIRSHAGEIEKQTALSDSLSNQIVAKQKDLVERNKLLNEKETFIKKQSYWLFIELLVILIVLASIILIARAYIVTRRARQKIAEHKQVLEATLEQLKSMQQQLIQSEKMASLGVFIAGIAHEINNPINFISMGVDGLEKVIERVIALFTELDKLTPESQGYEIQKLIDLKQNLKFQRSLDAVPEILGNIKIGISRTTGITNGLRMYARMDSEEKSLCDISQIIETALQLIKPQLNSGIEIKKAYGNVQQLKVFPGKLSQVFVNILSNAIDSIHSMGSRAEMHSISITTCQVGKDVHIEFSDSGQGIPMDVIPKIFDPFYTTKEVGKGTGLGLSIAISIIEEHNGTITAENNPGSGATFKLEIPINIENHGK